jgi:hypothetical protein
MRFLSTRIIEDEAMTLERRKHRRSAIESDEIQVCILPIRKTFSLKNISKGGLVFEYVPVEDERLESESDNIIAVDFDQFYLTKIACKTVYDISTLMHGKSFTGGAMRLRGLEFVEITKEQEDTLDILF